MVPSPGGVYEAVGQKRQLEADLTLWGPSPKIPATDPAMFQQALNSLVRGHNLNGHLHTYR